MRSWQRSCSWDGRRAAGRPLVAAIAALAAAGVVCPADANSFDEALETRLAANAETQQSQKRIDALADEADQLLLAYTNTMTQLDALKVFNRQYAKLIDQQSEQIAQLTEEIDNVELVGRQITPLMLKMIDGLERFVELDVPFLRRERAQRVHNLRDAMAKADVTDAEKYRAIMEAYSIENEYGRTIESYVDRIEIDGTMREADFLRIGRVALVYMTPDGEYIGAWDQNARSWVPLDRSYQDSVKEGLRMARKQAAPSLILVPVTAPENL
ncbi:MAG: DUF3450 domain-containing protein [Myxococcota bacterium]|nr:DUF3450 domain-containing protein [Myxococcales bacterium]